MNLLYNLYIIVYVKILQNRGTRLRNGGKMSTENEFEKNGKMERILGMYTTLMNGGSLYKAQEAEKYGVSARSIQRDIEEIRNFLSFNVANTGVINTVEYDRTRDSYHLVQAAHMKFTNSEILAICKILLDSRAFTKKEMDSMLQRLVDCCVKPENHKMVKELIQNEQFYYVPPQHNTVFIDTMWKIGEAIQKCRYIEIEYQKMKGQEVVKRKLKPVSILFSEFYFYMTAFIDDADEVREHFDVMNDSFPTIYRIDRIKKLKILREQFHIPYKDRFEEGEFRKRVQFMYGGKLQRVKFRYKGDSIEAVKDRLPTAEVIRHDEDGYVVTAEVFGKGIGMWLRSQGEMVEVMEI